MTLARYASGFALWRAEHPRSRAGLWMAPTDRSGIRRCVGCAREFARYQHLDRCNVIAAYDLRAACVRWLVALPAVDDEALLWLRALPQQDHDAVVVARAGGAA